MQSFKTFLKAVAIMVLAAGGAAALVEGFKASYDAGVSVFWGVIMVCGAFFLYRAWFWGR
jgi:hypothetical protein